MTSRTAIDEELIDPSITRARRRRNTILVSRIVLIAALVVAWEAASPLFNHLVFSSPSEIASKLWEWTLDGTLARNLFVTLQEIVFGYIAGASIAIVLGLLLGSYPTAAAILDPILMAIYGVPKIAFGPLFIVWFGISLTPKVVICGLTVFFFIFYSTYEGARNADRDLLRTVRLMGATKFQERMLVIVPGALPAILLGLKLAIPEALVGAIVGELIVSSRGIGYLIEYSATQLDSAGMFAGLLLLMTMAVIFNSAVSFATGTARRHRDDE